jgi:hypothetical protein
MEEIISTWAKLIDALDIQDVNHVNKIEHIEKFTEKLCWHCCHPIPTECKTLHYPYKLLSSGKFQVGGQFCSWECVKGHGRDHMSRVLSGVHQLNIRHYRKMITGLSDPVIPAPPRMVLKAFGGHMDIDEFRKSNSKIEYVINYAKMVKVTPYETHEYKFEDKHVNKKQSDRPMNIDTTTVVNDSLKLRRPKPAVKGKSTLERSLGLNNFGNLIKTH